MNESKNPSAIRSKQQIMNALVRLMKEHPYNEITVKQIILETDLVRKTFYRNFTSKDDVLDAWINRKVYEYSQALLDRSDPLNVIFEFCEKNRDFLELLNKNNLMYLLLLRLNDTIPLISESTEWEKNPFRKLIGDLDPDYIIAFNTGAIWNVITKWVDRGMKESPEEIRKILAEYIARLGHTTSDAVSNFCSRTMPINAFTSFRTSCGTGIKSLSPISRNSRNTS